MANETKALFGMGDGNFLTWEDYLAAQFDRGSSGVVHYDPVSHPVHYNQGKIEVIDFILDQKMNYIEGNVIKYVSRYKNKNGLQDLEKAQFYLKKLIEQVKKQ